MCFAPQRRALLRHRSAIESSKSGPNPRCFDTFYLEMCFAPQWRALFRHRMAIWTSKSGPCTQVFCHFLLRNVLRATTACTFSTSERPKVVRTWCVLYIFTSKCASRIFAPQPRALFPHLNFQKWSERGVFCTFLLPNAVSYTHLTLPTKRIV